MKTTTTLEERYNASPLSSICTIQEFEQDELAKEERRRQHEIWLEERRPIKDMLQRQTGCSKVIAHTNGCYILLFGNRRGKWAQSKKTNNYNWDKIDRPSKPEIKHSYWINKGDLREFKLKELGL